MTPKQKNEFLVVEFFFRISEHLCPSEVKNSTFTKKKINVNTEFFCHQNHHQKSKMIFKKSRSHHRPIPKNPHPKF